MLYSEGSSSASAKQWVAIVVAHELAHQVITIFVVIIVFAIIVAIVVAHERAHQVITISVVDVFPLSLLASLLLMNRLTRSLLVIIVYYHR